MKDEATDPLEGGEVIEFDAPDSESVGADADVEVEEVTFQFPDPLQKRVAIVGFATGHAHLAPFDDPNTEIWGLNQLWKVLPERRFDRWFELHDLDLFYRSNAEHRAFLKAFDGPVYVRGQDYALALEWGIENAVPFPDEIVVSQFFRTSTIPCRG